MESHISKSKNRWIATAASIWIQAIIGASYTFSIYSPILKSSQSYDQSTLDTVSVFKDIGSNAGVLSGLLYTAVSSGHNRYGVPWVVHVVGAVEGFLGYFFIWLAVVGLIPPLPVPLMCVFMFLAAHSQTYFNTWNVVTCVQNFPDYSGTVVGLMKGFLGLSGAILIQVYKAFFKGNPSTYILMLALLPSIVSLSLMYLVTLCPDKTSEDKNHLNAMSIVSILLAAYLMIILILEDIIVFPEWARLLTFLTLLLFLSLPLKIASEAKNKEKPHPIEKSEPLLLYDEYGDLDDEPSQESMNLMEAAKSLNFWLLFVTMLCGMGSGLATINNMSQLGQSLGYNTSKVNTLVSLWSIWNFFGRFGAGYISDFLLRQKGLSRPFVMAIALAAMTVGHVIIGTGFVGNLYIGTILVGICYGAQWSLMPTITSEIFGVLHMGTIYNAIAIANPLGTYVLSVWVIGHIYDKEAGEGHNSCFGVHCFMLSFFILAFVSFMGFLVALILFFRTRVFYRCVVLRRLCYSLKR
ncbi:protein NUCLEAR FUSION DEFECTIVE 4 isoform X2 [Beta vulgaris subsp. vulgaris]|uniref:protein NUCLEAR FUSION DEFECTIVE 4 isoform X2 n=1 Tax=Beta vulgaris subsp. vulgaris TaxID=3555 RepID=UPI002037503C|nr:protein NUCLEAR FUSION DEFECTIVE 4 isoform X2 [Beta vulgaris subsp. vulgaris]